MGLFLCPFAGGFAHLCWTPSSALLVPNLGRARLSGFSRSLCGPGVEQCAGCLVTRDALVVTGGVGAAPALIGEQPTRRLENVHGHGWVRSAA